VYKVTFEYEVDEYSWEKDEIVVKIISVMKWPSYFFSVAPDLKSYDAEKGINPDSLGNYCDRSDSGGSVDFEFPEEMKKSSQKKFINVFEEDGFGGLEDLEWTDADRETRCYGAFEIEEVKD
jgi:hypothetical protein